ncbi:MAG TPA: ABC transporter permease [Caldisericia bacterium]|nr:ABC transporter permease [Caldisericia bacterium]HPF48731.1 ABC transporter permease [Caldisericia bacterium]HPI83609.1 ABC transporter permease [Caldisericia bacterium]HPQ93186.1 ABC transporter permease [Caldisericia bacterium]HRV74981.1 ABC transporter permease [Caldisericia bacterium]
MNRFLSTLKNDFRLLSRHNLVSAAIFITILWVIMLYLIVLYEPMTTAFMIPLLLFEDTATIGFFFMAGLILFEKDQGVLQGIATTPQKPAEYITSKVLSLSLLSVVSGMIYAIAGVVMNRIFLPNSSGIPLLWASLGLLMISVFYCFIGYASVSKFQNVNKYILVGSLYFLVLNVPLLGFFGVVDGWWLYLFPTQPYLLLMMTTNRLVPLEMWQYVYSISYGLVCIIVAWYFARRAYRMNMGMDR